FLDAPFTMVSGARDFVRTPAPSLALFVRRWLVRPLAAGPCSDHALPTALFERSRSRRDTFALGDLHGGELSRDPPVPGLARAGRRRANSRDRAPDAGMGDIWPGTAARRGPVGPPRRHVQHADRRQEPLA